MGEYSALVNGSNQVIGFLCVIRRDSFVNSTMHYTLLFWEDIVHWFIFILILIEIIQELSVWKKSGGEAGMHGKQHGTPACGGSVRPALPPRNGTYDPLRR